MEVKETEKTLSSATSRPYWVGWIGGMFAFEGAGWTETRTQSELNNAARPVSGGVETSLNEARSNGNLREIRDDIWVVAYLGWQGTRE